LLGDYLVIQEFCCCSSDVINSAAQNLRLA